MVTSCARQTVMSRVLSFCFRIDSTFLIQQNYVKEKSSITELSSEDLENATRLEKR